METPFTPASKGSESLSILSRDSGVPQPLVYLAIAVGILFTAGGVWWLTWGPSTPASLMTCIGFGIVLVSLGSKAGGSWGQWSATGAGAMALLLFIVLEHYEPYTVSSQIRRGQMQGDLSKVADIRIVDESPLYEYRDLTTQSERFIFLESSFHSQRLSVMVDTNEKGEGKEFFELVGNASKIAKMYFAKSSNMDSVVQWSFDYTNRTVKDGNVVIFAEPDKLDENLLPSAEKVSFTSKRGFVDAAFAQGQPSASASDGVSAMGITQLVADLESDDPTLRRNARDALIAIGTPAIQPLMSALRNDSSNYRLKGGVIYILSGMLFGDQEKRAEISANLRDDDFPILVLAASDDDKTVRLQASEFLYELHDARVIPYSVDAARTTYDGNKASNQVSILGQSGRNLPNPEQSQIFKDLTGGPGPNNEFVKNQQMLRKTLGF